MFNDWDWFYHLTVSTEDLENIKDYKRSSIGGYGVFQGVRFGSRLAAERIKFTM